jgi:hypothetical protein
MSKGGNTVTSILTVCEEREDKMKHGFKFGVETTFCWLGCRTAKERFIV